MLIPPYTKTEDGFELQFGVNHFAHFLLTNLLFDCIKEAPSARIVKCLFTCPQKGENYNFDDLQLEISYTKWDSYAQSKLANILFTRSLGNQCDMLFPVVSMELARQIPQIFVSFKGKLKFVISVHTVEPLNKGYLRISHFVLR